ncbi:hypothetical protein Salat_2772800 [Sesamum alatum]|uniref:Uncharacterized protein n=1 Tax=Sesamum alatum TaxID=300844 RepID=A0AAE2C979_9LAMI|nr:hypothetical protein Salat_2772800 [Sesamum alatum]
MSPQLQGIRSSFGLRMSCPDEKAWREIFGKDIAGGDPGEDVNDAGDAAREEEIPETQDYYVLTADWNSETATNDRTQGHTSNINPDPTATSSSVPMGSGGSAKKRKRVGAVAEERLVEMVCIFLVEDFTSS